MNAVETLTSYRAFLDEEGEDVIIRRRNGDGSKREARVRARVSGFQATQLVGAIIQGDINVIALNDPDADIQDGMVALAALLPVLETDKLVVRGEEKAIKGVNDNTRRVAGVLIALDIHAEG